MNAHVMVSSRLYESERASTVASYDALGAGNTRFAHSSGDHGRVRGFAAAARQYALGSEETVNVLGTSFLANKNDLLSRFTELLGEISVKYTFA